MNYSSMRLLLLACALTLNLEAVRNNDNNQTLNGLAPRIHRLLDKIDAACDFAYGMDPESLTSSSSSSSVAHNNNEPVGGWITIPKDLFNGGLPKGTKISPLEILQLSLMSSPTLIYDTYAEGFHHLQQQGSKVSPDHKCLILLAEKKHPNKKYIMPNSAEILSTATSSTSIE